jgi:hypothetical protein
MIEISDLLADPDFAQPFDIIRETVTLVQGRAQTSSTTIPGVMGVIQPASVDDLVLFVPEGERANEWISIWCPQEIRAADGVSKFSDVIVWRGKRYRVAKAKPWETQGYYRAWAQGFQYG